MDIKKIKGVGEKKAALFNRLSIYDTKDLIRFYPRDYEVYEKPVFIKDILKSDIGRIIAIEGVVAKNPGIFRNGKKSVSSVIIKDFEGNAIKCNWYNMPYIRKMLIPNSKYIFRGYLNNKRGEYILEQPTINKVCDYEEMTGVMRPVYRLTKGLSGNAIISAVSIALENHDEYKEFLSDEVLKSAEIINEQDAIQKIHFPENREIASQALRRIIFDEFFLFSLSVMLRKQENLKAKTKMPVPLDIRTDKLKNSLSFKLTDAQEAAWEDIKKDMASNRPMNRLLQGDVGSGKTIIAMLAMINAAYSGFQSALMAPTEVLAVQEGNELIRLIKEHNLPFKAEILTGSIKSAQKNEIYKGLEDGDINMIIGTHALIQEKVKFKKCGLIITDEQHRFGVGQRKELKDKAAESKMSGDTPNILVMSATPIPRTLAWVLYADLDITVMDELPAERIPIKNAVVDTGYRPQMYKFIGDIISKGQQVYVICPMIEEGDMEGENVTDCSMRLKKNLSKDIKIEILHGQMTSDDKQSIMKDFSDGKTDILVSTTVIEVGINVPNATVMIIENAEKFGLSQLHQLRGRVGRGNKQSYCIFVSDTETEEAKERLSIISSSNSGFEIAEKDMNLRGPGDFFGIRQSGDLNFSMADPKRDADILSLATKAAGKIIKEDPYLTEKENESLKEMISSYLQKEIESINL